MRVLPQNNINLDEIISDSPHCGIFSRIQALISVVSLTKAFLLKFLRISPVMRSIPGAFLGG
jgi:hypothetical protein